MGTINYRSGNVSIAIGDGLQRVVERMLEDKNGHIMRAMEAELELTERRIAQEWPVASGDSKAGFATRIELTEGRVSRKLANAVNYLRYIRGRQQGGKSSWREVVVKPALDRSGAFAERARRELEEVNRG